MSKKKKSGNRKSTLENVLLVTAAVELIKAIIELIKELFEKLIE